MFELLVLSMLLLGCFDAPGRGFALRCTQNFKEIAAGYVYYGIWNPESVMIFTHYFYLSRLLASSFLLATGVAYWA